MVKRIYFLAVAAAALFGELSTAQTFPWPNREFQKLAQSTMTFLNIGVGAKAMGMGGAYTCMEKDANALFWNPAGISKIDGGSVSMTHTQWIADTKQYALALAYGFGKYGTFGLSLMAMDNGAFERTVPDPTYTRGFYSDGTFQVGQWAAGVAYGRQLTNKFSIGGQFKYAYQDLGNADFVEWSYERTNYDTLHGVKNRKGTLAMDFGTLYYTGFKDLRIGMSFRNFSAPVRYVSESFNLPIVFRVGTAMDVLKLISDADVHALQLCLEAVYPYDHAEGIQTGGEYRFKNFLSLRAGYQSNRDLGEWSAGFGISPKAVAGLDFSIDYTVMSSENALGTIQIVSMGFAF